MGRPRCGALIRNGHVVMTDHRYPTVVHGSAGKKKMNEPAVGSSRVLGASPQWAGAPDSGRTRAGRRVDPKGEQAKAGAQDARGNTEGANAGVAGPGAGPTEAEQPPRSSADLPELELGRADPPHRSDRSADQSSRYHQAQRSRPFTIDVRSLVFDPQWYLAQYEDVAAAQLDPVQHYLDNGSDEGRDPNPFFSTVYYCDRNPDVVASGMNPFLHYVLYGAREGRVPCV